MCSPEQIVLIHMNSKQWFFSVVVTELIDQQYSTREAAECRMLDTKYLHIIIRNCIRM